MPSISRAFNLKKFAHRAFYEFHTREFRVTNDVLAGATIASVAAFILETIPALQKYAEIWTGIEYAAVTLFAAEYLLRITTERSPLLYATSFYGIIDLLAILPSILGVGNLTALKSARALRILKFLRIIRLSEIARLAVSEAKRELGDLDSYWDVFRFELTVYVLVLLATTMILGGTLYYLEPENPSFTHIPEAMYWVLSIIFGGSYGASSPTTMLGTIVFFLARFVGIVLFAFLAGAVGLAFEHSILRRSPIARKWVKNSPH